MNKVNHDRITLQQASRRALKNLQQDTTTDWYNYTGNLNRFEEMKYHVSEFICLKLIYPLCITRSWRKPNFLNISTTVSIGVESVAVKGLCKKGPGDKRLKDKGLQFERWNCHMTSWNDSHFRIFVNGFKNWRSQSSYEKERKFAMASCNGEVDT